MENVEVFSKYPVTNNEWLLYSSFEVDINLRRKWGSSLGTEMMSVCRSDGGVSDVVKSEIVKLNDVSDFYVRNIMRGLLTTTSIEGVSVACLDVVGNDI